MKRNVLLYTAAVALVVATACTTTDTMSASPAGGVYMVDDVLANRATHMGHEMTIRGTVVEVLSPTAFTIGTGNRVILVHAADAAVPPDPIAVGNMVLVTGPLGAVDMSYGLHNDMLARFNEGPGVRATAIAFAP